MQSNQDESKKKILIIDDEEFVVRSIHNLLEKKGCEVDVSLSSAEGVEKAINGNYNLIISDIRMPGLDGVETLETIKKRAVGRHMNFMMITGHSADSASEESLRLGITDFLLKPLDTDQFLQAVERNLAADGLRDLSGEQVKRYDPRNRWQFPQSEFVYEKLVTLKDTNMEGNVYFANYLCWQGETREALLLSHPNFAKEAQSNMHIKMITHTAYQRYLHESYLGDIVQVKMTMREAKQCSFILVFRFFNKKTGVCLGEGWERIAFVDTRSGKICAVPHYVLDLVVPISEAAKTITLNS